MSKIKNLLSRILPSPAQTFHNKIQEIFSKIEQLEKNDKNLLTELKSSETTFLTELKIGLKNLINKIEQLEKNEINILNEMNNEIKILIELKNYIDSNVEKRILFTFSPERGRAANFMKFRERADFEKCFYNLINGLDEESRRTVFWIQKRMELIHNEKVPLDLFTSKEQHELKRQNEYLKNVLKVSNECFCMDSFILPINYFTRSVFFDKHGIYLVRDMKKIKDKHIIDAGAFIGDSLLILSDLTHKQVHCFEAMSQNYKLLEKTISMNNIKNAITNKIALGAEHSKLKFAFLAQGVASTIAEESQEFTEEVNVIPLDDYVSENNLEVGLIKIDIEGMEQFLLKGAKKTICQQKLVLLISIYHNPEDFYFIKPEIESWDLGYKFKIHKPIDDRENFINIKKKGGQ